MIDNQTSYLANTPLMSICHFKSALFGYHNATSSLKYKINPAVQRTLQNEHVIQPFLEQKNTAGLFIPTS